MHYYKFNISDYRKDTSHLTLVEHGIYRMLIDTYYLNEKPLSDDIAKLMRSHSIRTEVEEVALKNVLDDFFSLKDNGYHHKGCDQRLTEIYAKSEKARDSAKARWKKDANAVRTQCEDDANSMLPITQDPLPTTQAPKQKKKVAVKNDLFDAFWKEYPKSQGKAQALKTWAKLNPNQHLFDLIISSVVKFKSSNEWTKDGGQFIPNASTWLNGERWDDKMTYGAIPNERNQLRSNIKETALERMDREQAAMDMREAASCDYETILDADDSIVSTQIHSG